MRSDNRPITTIGVIIPTFNRISYLRSLLQQLFAQQQPEGTRLVPVVVIDGSTDGTYEMIVKEYPGVKILNGPGNWWWTKSTNEGIKLALSGNNIDYILLLNDDSIIEANYINSLMQSLKDTDKNCIIGSISVTDSEPRRVSFSGVKKINWVTLKKQQYHKNFEFLDNIPPAGLFPSYALNGRGTFVASAIIKDLNYLNEASFPQYGSDDDLALRAWKKGYKVLISYSCRVYDRTQDTSKGTAFRKDKLSVFFKSFITWNSVNYIPKQVSFFYQHGIKILMPFYIAKFLLGTSYAYFVKYKKLKNEL